MASIPKSYLTLVKIYFFSSDRIAIELRLQLQVLLAGWSLSDTVRYSALLGLAILGLQPMICIG